MLNNYETIMSRKNKTALWGTVEEVTEERGVKRGVLGKQRKDRSGETNIGRNSYFTVTLAILHLLCPSDFGVAVLMTRGQSTRRHLYD